MRLTVLSQYARDVAHYDAAEGDRLVTSLEGITETHTSRALDKVWGTQTKRDPRTSASGWSW